MKNGIFAKKGFPPRVEPQPLFMYFFPPIFLKLHKTLALGLFYPITSTLTVASLNYQ